MGFDHDFRRRADAVRGIPLESILQQWGALRDRCDKAKWRLAEDSFSITGAKFTHWQRSAGGGGAIDLVMHVRGMDVRSAVAWLEQQFGVDHGSARPAVVNSRSSSGLSPKPSRLRLPDAQSEKLEQVRRYLIQERCLAASLLEPLIEAGKLYADRRANAVFLMVAGKANRPVGAELRGTGPRVWRGLAPGLARTTGTSGSASRAHPRSSYVKRRSTPSVASNCSVIASVFRQRECEPILPGYRLCLPAATQFTAASTTTSLVKRRPAK
jgi:hypothetical protein